jgi:hypothetical protein
MENCGGGMGELMNEEDENLYGDEEMLLNDGHMVGGMVVQDSDEGGEDQFFYN